jgi:glycerol kinase
VVRAALESIPLQIGDLLAAMSGQIKLLDLRVDGGPSGNRFLMQLQADLMDLPVMVASTDAASARGAAFLAGRAVGIWDSVRELAELARPAATFTPSMSPLNRKKLIDGWREAVRQTMAGAVGAGDHPSTSIGEIK